MHLYIPALLALGALILLVAWLPLVIARLPLSLPIVCIGIGFALFSLPVVPIDIDPTENLEVTERFSEIIVLIALMGAGLKLDRVFSWRRWVLTWRLLVVAMPLTIAAVAAVGVYGLGLGVASALLLGAALAPTDPVLASDVQVGPPRTGQEDEVRFSLTSEAGLNDALAFPFVNLAILAAAATAGLAGVDWQHWALEDVAWKLGMGLAAGWVVGRALGWVTFHLPSRTTLSATGDGFVALGATLLSYAVAELLHGYGFLAVFVTAVTIRSAARAHDFHAKMHDFIDQAERLLTMVALLLFGGALADGLLRELRWIDVACGLAILFVARPLAAGLSLIGSGRPRLERVLISFFGIRGLGSVYYLAYALGEQRFAQADRLWAVAGFIILMSAVVHGITATPMMRALDLQAAKVKRRVLGQRLLRRDNFTEQARVRRKRQLRRSARVRA